MLKEMMMLISLFGLVGSNSYVKKVVKGDGGGVVNFDGISGKSVAASKKGYASNIFHYSDFKTSYFDNLTKNFGVNYNRNFSLMLCLLKHVGIGFEVA